MIKKIDVYSDTIDTIFAIVHKIDGVCVATHTSLHI